MSNDNEIHFKGYSEDFVEQVRAMRQAQKEYFKTKSHEALRRAKNLERQVDYILAAYAGAPVQEKLDL